MPRGARGGSCPSVGLGASEGRDKPRVFMENPRRSASRTPGTPRRRRVDLRRVAVGLGFLALSAHLLLPLVVTCRTYRSLTLDAAPPCCASKMACRPAATESAPETLRKDGVDCPYCKAASPFRHASPSTTFRLSAQATPLVERAHRIPASAFPSAPDITSASPRAPPPSSA